MNNPLGFQLLLDTDHDKAIDLVTAALKDEGFGVLTRIDVKATMKEKLDKDFRAYTILGACNPPLALQALTSEPQVGLLLPCNVTVDEREDGVLVSIIDPQVLLGMEELRDNPTVQEVATEARARLKRVAETLSS
jgi:uncharacterized protein (DUF302 family)